MRAQLALTVLVVAVAAGAGFLVGRGTRPDPVPVPESVVTQREPPPEEPPALRGTPPPSVPVAGDARPPTPTTPAGEGLDVDDEVARRAAAIREQARAMADAADATARRTVEQERARERALVEDAARGGTMALLRRLEKDWVPPYELLSSRERYAELFARQTTGGTVDGRSFDGETSLSDGDTIQFPPGRYEVQSRWLERLSPFPKDLAVEGYGMDETVIVLSSDLDVRDEVHSLTFRDLTIHCNDNYLERMRHSPYTLRLDRCRVIGFDMGAGGSKMLGGSVGAFYATGCRIEAGYGRAPGFGNLFDVRGALLVRLEDCDVVGPFRSVYEGGARAAQLFVRCRFTRMTPRLKRSLETPGAMARFEECTFEYLSDEEERQPREKRPITDINPAWK